MEDLAKSRRSDMVSALAKDIALSYTALVRKELAGVKDKSEAISNVYEKYLKLLDDGAVEEVVKQSLIAVLMLCCKEEINYSKGEYENDLEKVIDGVMSVHYIMR